MDAFANSESKYLFAIVFQISCNMFIIIKFVEKSKLLIIENLLPLKWGGKLVFFKECVYNKR